MSRPFCLSRSVAPRPHWVINGAPDRDRGLVYVCCYPDSYRFEQQVPGADITGTYGSVTAEPQLPAPHYDVESTRFYS
jgi:hypothetical protein